MPDDAKLVQTNAGPMWVFRNDAYVSRSLALYGEYVEAESELFTQLVRPGMTIVEAGANIGAHSVALAKACAPGPAFMFEPQRRVFQLLCANLAINGVQNAFAYPEALGRSEGRVVVPEPDYAAHGNFGAVSTRSEGQPGVPVRLGAIDDLHLRQCGFIKIDVEGAELHVLAGATQTLARLRPAIYVENDRKSQQASLISFLDDAGYRCFWHVAPLYRPNNFNGVAHNVFGATVALNMLAVPKESNVSVQGLDPINPSSWTSPVTPIDDTNDALSGKGP